MDVIENDNSKFEPLCKPEDLFNIRWLSTSWKGILHDQICIVDKFLTLSHMIEYMKPQHNKVAQYQATQWNIFITYLLLHIEFVSKFM